MDGLKFTNFKKEIRPSGNSSESTYGKRRKIFLLEFAHCWILFHLRPDGSGSQNRMRKQERKKSFPFRVGRESKARLSREYSKARSADQCQRRRKRGGGRGLILRREGNGRVRDFPHFTTQRFSFRVSRVSFWIVSRIRYLLPREELFLPCCLFSWLSSLFVVSQDTPALFLY